LETKLLSVANQHTWKIRCTIRRN